MGLEHSAQRRPWAKSIEPTPHPTAMFDVCMMEGSVAEADAVARLATGVPVALGTEVFAVQAASVTRMQTTAALRGELTT
jgi:hypothetical protein